MQSRSASPPTARRRSARVVLQPYHSCRRAPGFKTQQSDGLSLTPSCLSVSHSASILHPPPSNLLHAHTSTPSLQFILIFSLFHLHSLPLRSCSPDSWIFQSSHIHSTLHHQFVTKVEFHPFIFRLYLFHSIPWLSPSLSSFASLASTHAAHLSFLPFGRLRRLYIKPSLSRDHVELTQKYNVTT